MGRGQTLAEALIARAADERKNAELTFVDVVEFGEDGEPFRVYGRPPTIENRSRILRQAGDDHFEQALRTVIELALDENGEKLFTVEHLAPLRKAVRADIIEALAHRLNTCLSFEAAKKKSETTPSSDTASDSPSASDEPSPNSTQ